MELRAVCSDKERKASKRSCRTGNGVSSGLEPDENDKPDDESSIADGNWREPSVNLSGCSSGVFGGGVGKVWYRYVDWRRNGARDGKGAPA